LQKAEKNLTVNIGLPTLYPNYHKRKMSIR